MLKRLKNWLETHEEFQVKEICNIEKSCCPRAKTKFVDFDKVKEWFVKTKKYSNLASVDCLFIDEAGSNIYFVEMKGWKKFLKYNHGKQNLEQIIAEQAGSYNFCSKFEDSLFILHSIFLSSEFNPRLTKEQKKMFHDSAKHFILLTDIDAILESDPLSYFGATLEILSQTSSLVHERIPHYTDEALKELDPAKYQHTNLRTIVRKNCSEIDHYFRSLPPQEIYQPA